MTFIHEMESPVGRLTLACEGESLTGLWLFGQKYFGATLPPDARPGDAPVFAQARAWLSAYFAGRDPGPAPRLSPAGSPFRQEVWAALLRIPYGRTTTYGDIALQLSGGVAASRAVGGAVGRNPISLFIPCHRVVGADGSLTGYAGGVDKKIFLLNLERRA